MVVVRLTGELAREHVPALTALLRTCVDDGASVGFLPTSTDDELSRYWAEVAAEVTTGSTVLLIASEGTAVIGTVHVRAASMPNGAHRAEVCKLLVQPDQRRNRVATQLMAEAEDAARAMGRWLLVLDTWTGSEADHLYRGLGWTEVGHIDDYAMLADGTLGRTTIFVKDLR